MCQIESFTTTGLSRKTSWVERYRKKKQKNSSDIIAKIRGVIKTRGKSLGINNFARKVVNFNFSPEISFSLKKDFTYGAKWRWFNFSAGIF